MLLGISLEAVLGSAATNLEPALLISRALSTTRGLPLQALEIPLEAAATYPDLFRPEALKMARAAASDNGLTFSVHLPFRGLDLSSYDDAERRRSVDAIKRSVELGSLLEPFSYVLHLLVEQKGQDEGFFREIAQQSLDEDVMDRASASLREIMADMEPSRLSVENLRGNPFPQQAEMAVSMGASLCLDVGHALVQGMDPALMLKEHSPHVRELHLHDVRRTYQPGIGYVREDHQALGTGILALGELLDALKECSFDGLLTLEVFREDQVGPSLSRLLPLLSSLG